MKVNISRNFIFLVNSVILCMVSQSHAAGTKSNSFLEEVVVTAQKTSENQQSVPIAVTAVTGERLRNLNISDTTQITQQIPGLQLNTWSPNVTIFNLRGISQNNFTDNLEAPVAVYFDDAYVASINGLSGQLFDIKRVEVLRGPQGTLFGRNATGGLIHYVSNSADTEDFNGYFNIQSGNFDNNSIELAVGGGASGDRARFAVRSEKSNGYVYSKTADPAIPRSRVDIGGTNGMALKLNVQSDITSSLLFNFWLKYSKDDKVPTGGYIFEPCAADMAGLCPVDSYGRTIVTGVNSEPWKHYSETKGFLNRDTTTAQFSFTEKYSDESVFTSITNVFDLNKKYFEDGDATPFLLVNFGTNVSFNQVSQEIRYNEISDKVRWQIGAYFLQINSKGGADTIAAPAFTGVYASGRAANALTGTFEEPTTEQTENLFGNGFVGAVASEKIDLVSQNISVFGQAEIDIASDVVLTLGLRLTQDDKEIDWKIFYKDLNNPIPLLIDSSDNLAKQKKNVDKISYSDWAGRLALDWKVSDKTLVFASLNRGIKGGNWATGANPNINASTFRHEPERITSLEGGLKTDVSDRVRLNATIFTYDYRGYQSFSLPGGNPFIRNTGAKVSGGEIELFVKPNEAWDISLGATTLRTKVGRIFGTNASVNANGVYTGDAITNARLPNAPDYSLNYLASYSWRVSGSVISIQFDGVRYGDQYLEVTNGPGSFQKAYTVNNLSLKFETDNNNLLISVWSKNITNERYKVYSLDLGVLGTTTYYAPPNTYGVSLNYKF
ncbi:MAG: TonB-dependent receptor [Methylacidiphilales bacterium]|nr:TonB-dependent receptor [Candidatus Methylacidiphilales bacterium]